jgi:hypothetical protein
VVFQGRRGKEKKLFLLRMGRNREAAVVGSYSIRM